MAVKRKPSGGKQRTGPGREKIRSCEQCGAELPVRKKGPLPRFCDACSKARALKRAREKRWASSGETDRPQKINCKDCRAEIAPPKKGPLRERCPECYLAFRNAQVAEWQRNNPARVKTIKQRCYAKHADQYRRYGREYGAARYKEKREEILEKSKGAYQRDPDKFRKKEQAARRSGVTKARDRKRYWSDVQARLRAVIRSRLYPLVVGKVKAGSAVRDLGISIGEFRRYVEDLWQPGMSWDNYGSAWDLDHIFPLSKVDLTDRVQFLAACNYRNYRPLWELENHRKHARVSKEAVALFAQLCDEFRASPAVHAWTPPRVKGRQRL